MNIVMILPSLAKTGPGIVAKDLCEEYVKNGHVCKVYYFDDIVGLEMPCETEKIGFTQAIDFDNWDIIHSHMFRPDAYIRYHRNKIKRAKTLTTLHNPITYKAARTGFGIINSILLSQGWKFSLGAHDHIVCLNDETRSELPESLRNKTSVIFNGRDIRLSEKSLPPHDQQLLQNVRQNFKVIGTVSSLTRRKGIDQAIRALSSLPDYSLVVLGSGPEKQNLKDLAKSINVDDRVLFLGFKDNPADYLQYVDVFVMCTESEGFPLALIEAAACGKPCVLSDIPIMKSIITESNGVKFYKIYDVEDLADKIKEIYSMKDLMSEDIHDYYDRQLTADIMAGKYIDLYNSIGYNEQFKKNR